MRFLLFSLVGVLGFVVDAAFTVLFVHMAQLGVGAGRILAFLIAVTVTWYLNRRYTFRSSVGSSSWALYALLTSGGALLNVGVYLLYLNYVGNAPVQLLAGVALGSLVALAFNFQVSRHLVFR